MLKSLVLITIFCSASLLRAGSLQLTLPPMFYAVPGLPAGIYFDNIVLTEHQDDYRFEVQCDIGTTESKRWLLSATDKDVGDHTLSVKVMGKGGEVLEQGKLNVRVVPKNAGAGRDLKLMIVGDSLTAATAYPNEIGRLLSLPGNPTWKMIGTSKPASAIKGVAHEGYGGWRWETFLTKWEPKPDGVAAGPLARKSTSPFLFADDQGKGVLDLARYFKENSDGQRPDVVTFLLGINDCFSAKPDDMDAMDKHITGVLANADKLLAAFHAAAPKAVCAVGLTTPPNSRESGFEANYKGTYHRWGWKRIQHRLVQRMLEHFSGRESEGIVLVPTELNLDPVAGYPDNNGVHPNATGYAEIGTSFYAWIKSWMAGQ